MCGGREKCGGEMKSSIARRGSRIHSESLRLGQSQILCKLHLAHQKVSVGARHMQSRHVYWVLKVLTFLTPFCKTFLLTNTWQGEKKTEVNNTAYGSFTEYMPIR